MLLVGAGLLVQSFARVVNVDLGFTPANTVALQVFHYSDARSAVTDAGLAGTANFFRRTLRDIRALPGVVGAGAVSSLPLALADVLRESLLTLHDRPPPPPGEEPATVVSLATPGYFQTMRIPLRVGRWFDDRDDVEGPAVVVINETLARQHWPESDPLDQRVTVQLSGQAHTAEIVGVVGTVLPRGFESRPRPEVFLPHAQYPDGSMTYVVRAAGAPAAAVPAIQDVIWAAAPLETFYSVATVDELLSGSLAVATAQRTHEVGLRLALGAAPRDVRWMVVRGAVGLAGAGVAIGLLASIPVSRSLAGLLVDVTPFDFPTLTGVSLLLMAVAAAAAWSPARRAAATDPLAALRAE